MTTPEARLAALREALLDGIVVRARLLEAMVDVEALRPLSARALAESAKDQRRAVDSLALNFANLAGIIQDQIIRLVLLIEDGDGTLTRRDRRLRAEAIGLIERSSDVEQMAEFRNRIAHQYPRDPVRQERLLTDIVEQGRRALDVFDHARRFAETRYFGR